MSQSSQTIGTLHRKLPSVGSVSPVAHRSSLQTLHSVISDRRPLPPCAGIVLRLGYQGQPCKRQLTHAEPWRSVKSIVSPFWRRDISSSRSRAWPVLTPGQSPTRLPGICSRPLKTRFLPPSARWLRLSPLPREALFPASRPINWLGSRQFYDSLKSSLRRCGWEFGHTCSPLPAKP